MTPNGQITVMFLLWRAHSSQSTGFIIQKSLLLVKIPEHVQDSTIYYFHI